MQDRKKGRETSVAGRGAIRSRGGRVVRSRGTPALGKEPGELWVLRGMMGVCGGEGWPAQRRGPELHSLFLPPGSVLLDPVCLKPCPQCRGSHPRRPKTCWKNPMGNVLSASRLRPEAWRPVPGRVPIHLVSPARFSERLRLLWAEFPRFLPAPSPTCPDALPPSQSRAFQTQGGPGQISGWGGRATGIECRQGILGTARAVGSGPTGTFPAGYGYPAALEKH